MKNIYTAFLILLALGCSIDENNNEDNSECNGEIISMETFTEYGDRYYYLSVLQDGETSNKYVDVSVFVCYQNSFGDGDTCWRGRYWECD